MSVPVIADEIACAADLVEGKAAGLPVAVVRSLGHFAKELSEPGAMFIIRPTAEDMFRAGSAEALAAGVAAARAEFRTGEPIRAHDEYY